MGAYSLCHTTSCTYYILWYVLTATLGFGPFTPFSDHPIGSDAAARMVL